MAKSNKNEIVYEDVDAAPVKSFFVSMLTRDIRLEDAILDLLDNCVDGIVRSAAKLEGGKPYEGFEAEISFDANSFSITDNCGGIPWKLHEYAFRMGRSGSRPDDVKGTVGVYGIGMKRAIFKMGESCLISTQNGEHSYEVDITPEWIAKEDAWKIPVRAKKKNKGPDGTTIVIGDLYKGIKDRFSTDAQAFTAELTRMVATHYAFIIDKGFKVKINGKAVTPKPTRLVYSEDIKPFIYKTKIDDVEVFLTVGFTRPIPSEDELSEGQKETKYSSMDAGWTIVCNDRAVVYCDRTELTGWGEAGIARYHTQFIAISGIVEFKAADAAKLPTTTTKRGIDASSSLYLQIKNKMREGMGMFIQYTNKWKGRELEAKQHMGSAKPLSFAEIKDVASKELKFASLSKSHIGGEQYKKALPMPKKVSSTKRRISFVKDADEVKKVSLHLFETEDKDPSAVGEECFDLMLKEAS